MNHILVKVNVNSHFTDVVIQKRLSPLLFNFVLEPFLQHILQYISFVYFPIPPETDPDIQQPAPVKLLAYADYI